MTSLCKKIFGKFKKKKSFIRFYSMEPGVSALFPIIPSIKYKRNYLNWPDPTDAKSVKGCPGITKLNSTGWVIPAPADFSIRINDGQVGFEWREPWRFKTGPEYPQDMARYVSAVHGPSQTVPLLDDIDKTIATVVKIETPWRVESSDDIVFLMLPFHYNNEKRFSCATGILDSRFGYNLNIQLFWHTYEQESVVKAGTPLCHIIPISREHLSYSTYDVTVEDAKSEDWVRERAWVYASNCTMMPHDSLSNRLNRLTKILKHYAKKD